MSLARNVGNLGNILSVSGQIVTMAASPPLLDASLNLATTSFVKKSGLTFGSFTSIAAATVLSVTAIGQAYLVTTSGIAITLPAVSQCSIGSCITFVNTSGSSVTLKGSGSDLISTPNVLAGSNTITLYSGESIIVSVYSSRWQTALYDQIGSPTFGTPRVGTAPSQFDNSTLVPNTSWVNGRGIAFSTTVNNTSSSTTLTASAMGSAQNFTLSGAQTVTLPATAGLLAGTMVQLVKYGTDYTAHSLTVSTNGSAAIISLPNQTNVASINMIPGDTLNLFWDGTNWRPSGSRLLRTSSAKVGQLQFWHGAINSIASVWGPGWQLANGTNGTANLVDRFVVGAGGSYAVNATGGASSIALSISNLPPHNHGVNDPGHAHSVADPAHAHSVADPSHNHAALGGTFVNESGSGGNGLGGGQQGYSFQNTTAASYTGIGIYAATTNIGIYAATTGISTQYAGGGTAFSILPPYYAVCILEYTGIGA